MRIGGGLVVLVIASACTTSEPIRWRVIFSEPTLTSNVVRVELEVIPGGCQSGLSAVQRYDVTPTMPAGDASDALAAGTYGLVGRAVDVDCGIVARGCQEVTIPTTQDEVVVTPSAPAAPELLCPADRCDSGTCGCADGMQACDALCVSVSDDPMNCGACGNVCPSGELCVLGVCSADCVAPLRICNGPDGSRCVDLQSSVLHCGDCGMACSTANGDPMCASGGCTIACRPGFADCNSDASDGCEQSLDTATDCGSCGVACLPVRDRYPYRSHPARGRSEPCRGRVAF